MKIKLYVLLLFFVLISCIRLKENPIDPFTPTGFVLNYLSRNPYIEPIGILDNSFGNNGKFTFNFNSINSYGSSFAIDNFGKIIMGGSCGNMPDVDFCMIRINSNGTLDTSFGSGNGYVIKSISSNNNDMAASITIDSNGNILLGGYCANSGSFVFCIARFLPNGLIDTSFGSGYGYVLLNISSIEDRGQSIKIQPDGKILLGGYCGSSTNYDFCIARFNPDGTLDNTFGSGGYILKDFFNINNYGFSLSIDSNGKILLGGYCGSSPNYDFCIVRFNPDGTTDHTFNGNGIVIKQITSYDDYGDTMTIQSDGKILLGGHCYNGTNYDFCIARFNPDGTTNGVVTQNFPTIDVRNQSIAVDVYDKILLGGRCYNGTNDDFCIARFLPNGLIDTSFGFGNGYILQDISNNNDYAYFLLLQPGGKILLGGYCNNGSLDFFCITRFK